jgi:soluble P-type ATPase
VYFTKLPPICDIEIFTASGDHVTTIKHNANTSDMANVEIYDILSKNGQRVQSQTLVAKISTPNGAQTLKHFSIIVGGFRVVD